MKQFLVFFPILIFVLVYIVTRDIFLSTGALMAGFVVSLAYELAVYRAVEKRTLMIFGLAMVLGGATLLFRDETFIMWKPTVVNCAMAIALLGSYWLVGKNLIKMALGSAIELPESAWQALNYGWAAGFFLAAILNLLVAYNFDTDVWVAYKVVGGFGLTIFYTILSFLYLYLAGHLQDLEPEQAAVEGADPKPSLPAKE